MSLIYNINCRDTIIIIIIIVIYFRYILVSYLNAPPNKSPSIYTIKFQREIKKKTDLLQLFAAIKYANNRTVKTRTNDKNLREKRQKRKKKFALHSRTRGRGSIYRVIGQLNDWMAAFWRNFAKSNFRPVFSLSRFNFNRLSLVSGLCTFINRYNF